MSNYKFLFFILFIIFLQSKIQCEVEPEKISIGFSDKRTLYEESSFNAYFVLEYTEQDLSNKNNLVISAKSSSFDNPAFIYTSFTEKNPSADNRAFYSQSIGLNELIINTLKLKNSTKLYINIHSLKQCEVSFEVITKDRISLSLDNKKLKFKLSDLTQIYFTPTEEISSKKLMFYSIGESANYFSMKIEMARGEDKKEFNCEQKFENGLGAVINLKEIQDAYLCNFIITIIANNSFPGIYANEKVVEVGFDLAEEGKDTLLEINVLEHVYGFITTGENCYKIKNVDDTKNITILINSFNQALTFGIYDKEKEKKYSLDIFNNFNIKLPSDYFSENYFCLKKFTPKEKEKEELGEISYDFQIYYDDELPKIQTFIDPLVNGRVYTHSLKAGEIIVYRHSSFTRYNFLYSASMNVIWGKPVLYGYSCKTFPECNLDEEKLENLKKTDEIDIVNPFNQYFINKKYYAVGDQDKYGEKMSEAREQYLSVVKCESTDDFPNYGECKYTIEIDNYLDEIQLIPETVFTNSLQFYKNYYKIKVADYKNIQFLNIYFTILTGNANINLYSDKEHKNLITNYNFRHVHRKEVFEIKDNFLENYYILINSNDSAFVEIKYETDFHYKGYMRLNPNEVNIEFVNKENNLITYEVNNPDYFYPRENPKNNDFYYTIKSLDCSMVYYDLVNITSFHREIKTDDINFGTSYALTLKVENYFHTTEDNKEDCTMIIYTGEESSNTPLLIMEDVPNPSNFTNTYYIYPFSISSSFDGIIVEIKSDTELLTKMNNPPNIIVTFKIANQKENFETYNIKGDYTFYIKKKTISKYCPTNYYQCSLTIEINKIIEEQDQIPYEIITSVHSSMSSVEYILKNKVYSHSLPPKSSRYFYTQIDKDEEGEINFMFNKGNGQIFARLVEKNKIDEQYNWNRRVKLPDINSKDLLYYDTLNNVIKYSSKDKNNCINGCELYIHIQSQEKTEKGTSFTEVSFSVDHKRNEINENSVVEMNMNKYVKGTFEKNKYKYYTITIPEDYYKISVNLYSQYGKAYIKLGKGHICKKDEYSWEINPTENFGRVIIYNTDEIIHQPSLKGVSISIGITNIDNLPDGDINDKLSYYLEIQGLYNNDKDYYNLISERSILCNTGNDNYCHVLIYLNHYYNINYNLIYAPLLNNNTQAVNIYSKYYKKDDLEKYTYKDSIQSLFPTSSDYSQNSNGKNYLLFDSNSLSEKVDNYILLTIDCGKKNSLIKLILSDPNPSKTLLPYNTEKLFWLYRNMNFYLPYNYNNNNDENYIINVKTIIGGGELVIENGDSYTNIQGNYVIEANSYPYAKSFEINYSEDYSIFIINYEKKKNDKLIHLEKNIKNQVSYDFSGDNSLPQYIYTELTSPLKIEIYFHDIENIFINNEIIAEDLFSIETYIINENTLNKRKLNPDTIITGDKIEGYYLKNENTGIVRIESDKIKTDDIYYAYIIIDKDKNNTKNYKAIKTQYSVNEIDSGMTIYPNKYFFSSLTKINPKDFYLISKQSEQDNFLIIDIAQSIPVNNEIFIQEEFYPEKKFRNNLEENKIKEFDFHGTKRLVVDLDGYEGVKLWVSKIVSENEKSENYSINFDSVNNIESFENFSTFNDSVIITKNKNDTKKSNIIFNNMWRYRPFFFSSYIDFYIDIYEKNEEISDCKNISTIYMGNHEEKKYRNYKINGFHFEQSFSVETDISKEDIKSNYCVRIIADINNKGGTRKKFLYNSTLIDNGDGEPNKVEVNENLILYVILYMVIVCIIIMIIVVIFIKLHKKNEEPPEPNLNESNIPIQDKDRPSEV